MASSEASSESRSSRAASRLSMSAIWAFSSFRRCMMSLSSMRGWGWDIKKAQTMLPSLSGFWQNHTHNECEKSTPKRELYYSASLVC